MELVNMAEEIAKQRKYKDHVDVMGEDRWAKIAWKRAYKVEWEKDHRDGGKRISRLVLSRLIREDRRKGITEDVV
jgi:hypothetical protein